MKILKFLGIQPGHKYLQTSIFFKKFIKNGIQLLKEQIDLISNNKIKIKIDPKFVNKSNKNKKERPIDNNENHEEVYNKVVELFDGEILR